MAFSDHAIGFYLQVENQLSPELRKAESDYARLTRSLDRYNKAAYKGASRGFDQLTALVKAFDALPKKAARGYDLALREIRKRTKVVSQAVDLRFTAKSRNELQKSLSRAVSQALSGAKLRVRASFPADRLKMFDTALSLRAAYKGMTQPPDYMGGFKVKKFSKGGLVEGQGGTDRVPAMLTKGEMVLPVAIVEQLKAGIYALGAKGAKGIKTLANRFKGLDAEGKKLPKWLKQARDETGRFVKQEKGFKGIQESLEGIRESAGFLAGNKALEVISKTAQSVSGGIQRFGGEELLSFNKSIMALVPSLRLTRKEARKFGKDVSDSMVAVGGDATYAANAATALVEAGVTNLEMLTKLSTVVGLSAEATGGPMQGMAEMAYYLQDSVGLSSNQIGSFFMTLQDQAATTATSFEALLTQTKTNLESLGASLSLNMTLTPADRQVVLENYSSLSAALSENWIDSTGQLGKTFADAMGGDTAAMQEVVQLTGRSFGEIGERMQRGNFAGMFDSLIADIRTFDATSAAGLAGLEQLKDARGFKGTTAEFANLAVKIDGFNAAALKTRASVKTFAEVEGAVEALGGRTEETRTWAESLVLGVKNVAKSASVFGVSALDVAQGVGEMNTSMFISLAYMGKMIIKMGAMAASKLFKGGGLMGKFASILPGSGKAAAGPLATAGGGKAVTGIFKGIGGGLKFLGSGLTAFGSAMIGPGGLGLLALTGLLIGLGFALKLASPALAVFGDVIATVVDGVVRMVGTLAQLNPAQMLALGPALLATAVGVGALALATVGYGAALGLAAVGVGAFRLATGGRGLKSGGIASVVADLVGGLEPLRKYSSKLQGLVKVLGLVVTFLKDFAKISLLLAGLGVGSMVAEGVGTILSFFGVRSPMDMLADQSSTIARTVVRLVQPFEGLGGFTAEQLDPITQTLRGALGFLVDYGRLQTAIDELPGIGVFRRIGDSLRSFFGGRSGLDRLIEETLPTVGKLSQVLARFSEVQTAAAMAGLSTGTSGVRNLRQDSTQAQVATAEIDRVVAAVLSRSEESPVHKDLLFSNTLLQQILLVLVEQSGKMKGPEQITTTSGALLRPAAAPSAFTRGFAQGDM